MTSEASYKFRSEPAGTVIRALGGVRLASRRLGLSPEAVSRWNRPAERGGTGGYIPKRHWDIIVSATGRPITREFLASGIRERIDVASASKAKGDRFERAVVEDLRSAGFDAHRVPLSGAAVGFIGDVEIRNWHGRRFVIQCKHTKNHGAGGRTSVARMLGQVSWGRVYASGQELLAMRKSVFIAVLKDHPCWSVNTPMISIPGKQILAHLKDHDALLFRRTNGPKATREWMAIVKFTSQYETEEESSATPADENNPDHHTNT